MPGNLGNRAKTLKRVCFSHFGHPFAGMISRLDLLIDFLQILVIFDAFGHPFGECFVTNVCENG